MSNENKLPVVVYSKPGCVQCNAVYRWLDSHKIRYRIVDMSQDEQAFNMIKDMGYQQAPVVIIPLDYPVKNHHFSGFQPQMLEQLLVD